MNALRTVVVAVNLFFAAVVNAQPDSPTPGQRAARTLPEPYATKSVINHPKVIDWPDDKTPQAPDGFR